MPFPETLAYTITIGIFEDFKNHWWHKLPWLCLDNHWHNLRFLNSWRHPHTTSFQGENTLKWLWNTSTLKLWLNFGKSPLWACIKWLEFLYLVATKSWEYFWKYFKNLLIVLCVETHWQEDMHIRTCYRCQMRPYGWFSKIQSQFINLKMK